MKTPEQVDAIMAAIPEQSRTRWCGGEYGACACMGCVQVCNRAVILEKIRGQPYWGDPEYIRESELQEHAETYSSFKVYKDEWEDWMKRHAS